MEPIIRLANAIMNGENEQIDKMLVGINIQLKQEERILTGKHLLKNIM
jgi:elongation factor 2